MNSIADDYFDEMVNGKHKIDVLLGGGKSNFDRKDRNLIKEFKKRDTATWITARTC